MHFLLVAESSLTLTLFQTDLENISDRITCHTALHVNQAVHCLTHFPIRAVLLFPCPVSTALSQALMAQPPLISPYLLGSVDGALPSADDLLPWLEEAKCSLRLPRLALQSLTAYLPLATQLLEALDISPRLRAWTFLPEMMTLTMLHPPLLDDLQHFLYPLMAMRHHITPSAVERRLRSAVESTWNQGNYTTLERFFGQSVDPEKGKPTNREFLCQMQQRLLLSVRRIQANTPLSSSF